MGLTFSKRRDSRLLTALLSALFLLALLFAAISMGGLFSLAPLIVLPVCTLAIFPKKVKQALSFSLLAALLLWLVLRFSILEDGLGQLANCFFSASAAVQAYEYAYFSVSENAAALHEALALISLLCALGCVIFGKRCNIILLASLVLAAAYFGIVPAVPQALLLLAVALLNLLPREGLLLHGSIFLLLLALICLAVFRFAPEPNVSVSAAEERARDRLAISGIFYERTPEIVKAPETAATEPPTTPEERMPDQAVKEESSFNTLFLILVLLTLLILFPPAMIYDRAQKKRAKNRAGLNDEDVAAAIRAMYLYTQKWVEFSKEALPCPEEIYALWQEAAYSAHCMTEEQRDAMRAYMEQTVQTVQNGATRRERLKIQYRAAL